MIHNEAKIRLIVGLGNPGLEYERTRHNAGFMVIDRILAGFRTGSFVKSQVANSLVFAGNFRGQALVLQKPQTFMNLSGYAVAREVKLLGIDPESILVIYDDMDLPLGTLRLRESGSDGGHNGLKSIISELGVTTFKRLRIGIGRPSQGNTVDYVLSKFENGDAEIFEMVLSAATNAVRMVLTGGMARAMNQYNAWAPPEEVETNQ